MAAQKWWQIWCQKVDFCKQTKAGFNLRTKKQGSFLRWFICYFCNFEASINYANQIQVITSSNYANRDSVSQANQPGKRFEIRFRLNELLYEKQIAYVLFLVARSLVSGTRPGGFHLFQSKAKQKLHEYIKLRYEQVVQKSMCRKVRLTPWSCGIYFVETVSPSIHRTSCVGLTQFVFCQCFSIRFHRGY